MFHGVVFHATLLHDSEASQEALRAATVRPSPVGARMRGAAKRACPSPLAAHRPRVLAPLATFKGDASGTTLYARVPRGLPRRMGDGMSIDRAPSRDLLLDFRGEFGRHCVLVAQAMGKDWSRDVVLKAARGDLELTRDAHPLLHALRAQRVRCNVLLAEIKAQDIAGALDAARQALNAVEQEWNVCLPKAG